MRIYLSYLKYFSKNKCNFFCFCIYEECVCCTACGMPWFQLEGYSFFWGAGSQEQPTSYWACIFGEKMFVNGSRFHWDCKRLLADNSKWAPWVAQTGHCINKLPYSASVSNYYRLHQRLLFPNQMWFICSHFSVISNYSLLTPEHRHW